MKLRSYLRGLGLGIIVTALLMGLTPRTKELSDEEIKSKAKALGMVENLTLAEEAKNQLEETIQERNESDTTVKNPDLEDSVDIPNPENTVDNSEPENTQIDNSGRLEETQSSQSALEEKLEEDLLGIRESGVDEDAEDFSTTTNENNDVEKSDEQETESYTVTVKSGDSSVSVSKQLKKLGLVSDADAYDLFLCRGGYDKRICVGTYEIFQGATEEEIAKIICKMQ